MNGPTRIVAWSAALLGIGIVVTLIRTPPSVAPDDPTIIEAPSAIDDAEVAPNSEDAEPAKNPLRSAPPSEPPAIRISAAPLKAIPQNVEDLRVGNPLLAPVIEANERALDAEDKDPAWSAEMEARIVNEISQKALGLELADLQVDCRTTLCRVEMTFPLQLLQKQFEPDAENAVWSGRQPINSFLKALDLDFRQPTPGGLNSYGTPVVVGYVNRRAEKTNE